MRVLLREQTESELCLNTCMSADRGTPTTLRQRLERLKLKD